MKKKIKKVLCLFNNAFGAYKLHIGILALVGFLSGILEGVGVNALIPLFSFVTGENGVNQDFISRSLETLFSFFGISFGLTTLLIFIATMFVFKSAMLYVGTYIQVRISADYEKKIRTELFAKTLDMTWPRLLTEKIGYLEKLLSLEIKQTTGLLQTLSTIVLLLTGISMYLLVAFNISAIITGATLLLGMTIILLFNPFIKIVRKISLEVSRTNKEIAHFINEHMIGIKTIKASGVSLHLAGRGDLYFDVLRKLRIKGSLLSAIPPNVIQPVGIIFILFVFAFMNQKTGFSIASFVAIVYLIQRIFTYVQQLQTNLHHISGTMPYLENVLTHKKHTSLFQEKDTGGEKFSLEEDFRFKDVSFSYEKKEIGAIKNISFVIKKGEYVGLIGPSGAGKTTIVDLVLRLFLPHKGEITVDGTKAEKVSLSSWRRSVGYVSQDIFLLNDTIRKNISFYDEGITEKDIMGAARTANIHETIVALRDGYETIVGERGVMLSAGQRQRIVIARVLARKPEVLILDEATSALDNESELAIQKAVENLKGKLTVLVIAHRLSTVMSCERLYVLQGGTLIEEGRPEDLLRDEKSYFYRTYNIRK